MINYYFSTLNFEKDLSITLLHEIKLVRAVFWWRKLPVYTVNIPPCTHNPRFQIGLTASLREECPNTEFFLVRIFLHLVWIRRFTEQSVSGGNKCTCSSSKVLYYGRVRSCAIHDYFVSYGGMSFMLVALKRQNVSEPDDSVTWSCRTGVTFPFLRRKKIQYFNAFALPHY